MPRICHYPGCRLLAVRCEFEHQRGDMPASWYLRNYTLLNALHYLWLLFRYGAAIEIMWYCPDHAQEAGFCRGCGLFWPGVWDYDFNLCDAGLCLGCWGRPFREDMEAALRYVEERAALELDLDLDLFREYVEGLDFSGLDGDG